MLNTQNVKDIFEKIPPKTKMSLDKVYGFVKKSAELTAEDLAPYTDTRETNYPHWKNIVHSVLTNYKKEGYVEHDPESHRREFFPNGMTPRDIEAAEIAARI
ncbi:hypothetical protein [Ruminococcus sp.]|uniref:hypothetical protein n=1 Tax=Ruminococcus sp. TaxID=41978 RepID=UPI001B0109BC|nr:hypothetical protein [Ruminococcus sp.]MBO5558913.1 hypothetical protein [Ruminococcus sp.]